MVTGDVTGPFLGFTSWGRHTVDRALHSVGPIRNLRVEGGPSRAGEGRRRPSETPSPGPGATTGGLLPPLGGGCVGGRGFPAALSATSHSTEREGRGPKRTEWGREEMNCPPRHQQLTRIQHTGHGGTGVAKRHGCPPELSPQQQPVLWHTFNQRCKGGEGSGS